MKHRQPGPLARLVAWARNASWSSVSMDVAMEAMAAIEEAREQAREEMPPDPWRPPGQTPAQRAVAELGITGRLILEAAQAVTAHSDERGHLHNPAAIDAIQGVLTDAQHALGRARSSMAGARRAAR
ncbi:hypothetical protein [Nocardiopsis sp. NPDC057823]|uniref:hypothetical protein n=1 Tax=Nocardiopsis sp. NPDC057823 TaxID=3346256 RepID=UPI00367001E5